MFCRKDPSPPPPCENVSLYGSIAYYQSLDRNLTIKFVVIKIGTNLESPLSSILFIFYTILNFLEDSKFFLLFLFN